MCWIYSASKRLRRRLLSPLAAPPASGGSQTAHLLCVCFSETSDNKASVNQHLAAVTALSLVLCDF